MYYFTCKSWTAIVCDNNDNINKTNQVCGTVRRTLNKNNEEKYNLNSITYGYAHTFRNMNSDQKTGKSNIVSGDEIYKKCGKYK